MFSLNFAAGQVVAVGNASANSTEFTTPTYVHLATDTDCWIKIGTTATAARHTAGNLLVPANTCLNVLVPAGERVAVVHESSNGYLSIVPILSE